jgi:hypothetical protein
MKNSSSSLTSLKSINSTPPINSLTNIFNNRDFQKYIANMEENIIKISNDYYYFTQKYDTKIDNIINRYDGKTNKLFIDLRNRDCDYERFNKKIENIIKDLQEYKNKKLYSEKLIYIFILKYDNDLKNILIFLYVYTSFVFALIINYYISK